MKKKPSFFANGALFLFFFQVAPKMWKMSTLAVVAERKRFQFGHGQVEHGCEFLRGGLSLSDKHSLKCVAPVTSVRQCQCQSIGIGQGVHMGGDIWVAYTRVSVLRRDSTDTGLCLDVLDSMARLVCLCPCVCMLYPHTGAATPPRVASSVVCSAHVGIDGPCCDTTEGDIDFSVL